MLVPAIVYKEELVQQFYKNLYTDDMFLYQGYCHAHELMEIKAEDNKYQWAGVNKKGEVIGYLSYYINPITDSVSRFGLYSFDKGNLCFIRDVYNKLEELVETHRRIEWQVIGGNPILHNYIDFCKAHNGFVHHLHACTKDNNGKYRDEWILEIVK